MTAGLYDSCNEMPLTCSNSCKRRVLINKCLQRTVYCYCLVRIANKRQQSKTRKRSSALQVTSPHVLFLLLHRQPGTPYQYIFALWRNSLPLSVNFSHISSSLLLLSSHPAPVPLIRYTILALYKFICMYVCMYRKSHTNT